MLNILQFCRKLGALGLWQHQKTVATSSRFFTSDLSPETLYPNSKQKIFTPSLPPKSEDSFNGVIPIDQIQIKYDRSSGPGGQNVNKVNTKVDLRFHVNSANWLSDRLKEKLIEQAKGRINGEGFIVIKSDVTRFQQMNLADALEKLRTIIREAEKPKQVQLGPEKLEKIRRNQEKMVRERLLVKRQRSDVKAGRQAPILN